MTLQFDGCAYFRQRLVLSTLSCQSIKIKNIRSQENQPGLRDFEVNLLHLLEKLTNGSKVEINATGTSLYYAPGALIGGSIEHECSLQRSIGYFLEFVLYMAPFMKTALELRLKGVTNDRDDPSVDLIKYSAIPIMKRFLGSDDGLEFKINKRGAKPNGGGEIFFRCPTKMKLRPCQWTDVGKIKRIRGVAYAMRVSPSIANRLIETAKGLLLKFLPDVYIYVDHQKGINAGLSPGYGLTLAAETKNGTVICAESCSIPRAEEGETTTITIPEELAKEAVFKLLDEIYKAGVVDSFGQSLIFHYMALNQADVSKVITGPLNSYSMQYLRYLKQFFQIMFKIENAKELPKNVTEKMEEETNESDEEKNDDDDNDNDDDDDDELKTGSPKILLTAIGIGYHNLTKTLI
ncbi:unnamed protein product [Adineta steineri]|uniref:RNA 3'-terminal phosphate cyclase-like protein n=1 Tax=Adineta steineri TaxID=433720 RepID=A0A818I049_9BILA|nr:unnamed protein product [Adineta steineri]CAF3517557.1 unnamed protein product [Adineta steineri]